VAHTELHTGMSGVYLLVVHFCATLYIKALHTSAVWYLSSWNCNVLTWVHRHVERLIGVDCLYVGV